MFGMSSIEELPELPKYKIDENEQIVIDEIIDENKESGASKILKEENK